MGRSGRTVLRLVEGVGVRVGFAPKAVRPGIPRLMRRKDPATWLDVSMESAGNILCINPVELSDGRISV